MKRIYSAINLQEAHLIAGLLQRSGIEVTVENENLQGGVGEIPFTHAYPEIYLIDERDQMRAAAIIAEYENSQTYLETVTCRRCGEDNPANFSCCWSCGMLLGDL